MKLQLQNLCKQYSGENAVDNVTVDFTPGVYGLLGPNGAGKTTLMRMICGILKPSDGGILLNGKPMQDLGEEYYTHLGYMPQNFGFYPDFTAREFMLYMGAVKGIERKKAESRTEELLHTVNLQDVAGKKIKTFSGGMKQRLGIAQAQLNDPKILVLDEPTAGLDPKERVRFRNLLSTFAREKIVILSTHIVSDVSYIADKILLMKSGRFILHEPASTAAQAVKGLVWQVQVSEGEAADYTSRFSVVNLHHEDGGVRLRIVSEAPPCSGAQPAEPCLEDLFIYHFADEACAKGKEGNENAY